MHHMDPLAATRFHAVFHYGQEAVMVFFVLSGFVITCSWSRKGGADNWRSYMLKRALRIYPIFVAALAIAALSAKMSDGGACARAGALLGNLAMLQDAGDLKPGTLIKPFCGDSPLWSLSYEWWFYVLSAGLFFGMGRATWASRRIVAFGVSLVGAVTYIAAPNQASLFAAYFIIWWCGAELAHELHATGRVSLRGQAAPLLMLTVCCMAWMPGAIRQAVSSAHLLPGTYPGLPARHFVCAIGVVLAATMGLRFPKVLHPLRNLLASVGGISFGLYAIHEPVLAIAGSFGWGRGAQYLAAAAIALAAAWLLERVYQPVVVAVLRHWGRYFTYSAAIK